MVENKKIPVKRHKRQYKSGKISTVKRHNRLIKSFKFDKEKRKSYVRREAIGLKERDRIKGGLADNMPDSEFNKKQIEKGIEVEMEHTDNPIIAKEIAKDHLVEGENYYDYLEKMEEEMEEDKELKIKQLRAQREILENRMSELEDDYDDYKSEQYDIGNEIDHILKQISLLNFEINKLKKEH